MNSAKRSDYSKGFKSDHDNDITSVRRGNRSSQSSTAGPSESSHENSLRFIENHTIPWPLDRQLNPIDYANYPSIHPDMYPYIPSDMQQYGQPKPLRRGKWTVSYHYFVPKQ